MKFFALIMTNEQKFIRDYFTFCLQSEECQAREQMQDTMNRHEEELYQVRREYEMLRLEFEQNLSANEQSGICFNKFQHSVICYFSALIGFCNISGPLNKEIRLMLASAKAENQQLKQEANRFKRKWKEAVSSLAKVSFWFRGNDLLGQAL